MKRKDQPPLGGWMVDRGEISLEEYQRMMTEYRNIPEPDDEIARVRRLETAALAALCLCKSLLAVREGPSDDLIEECAAALETALRKSQEGT